MNGEDEWTSIGVKAGTKALFKEMKEEADPKNALSDDSYLWLVLQRIKAGGQGRLGLLPVVNGKRNGA